MSLNSKMAEILAAEDARINAQTVRAAEERSHEEGERTRQHHEEQRQKQDTARNQQVQDLDKYIKTNLQERRMDYWGTQDATR